MKKKINGIHYSSVAIGVSGNVQVLSFNPLSQEWIKEWSTTIYGEESIQEIEQAGMHEFLNVVLKS